MKIDLTKEEYHDLLDVLSIAAFVLDAGREAPTAATRPYKELTQKLYSYASLFGAGELVQFFPDKGEAYPTQAFEQTSLFLDVLEDYNDFIFWEELVARFAERDLIEDFGLEAFEQMSLEERIRREKEYSAPYWNEFEKHGLERTIIAPVD